MRKLYLGLAAATLAITATAALAETCSQRAANCVSKGGTKGACYEASRMADCKRTCQYVAPSGNVWDASTGCKKK